MGLAARQDRRYTYADYLTWDDDVRRELIDGEVMVMSPAPAREHQVVAGGIYSQLNERLLDQEGPCQAFVAPFDVRLAEPDESDEEADTVVQPDVLVNCDPDRVDRRGVRGAPDLVIEVISPSTAHIDQITKRELYERHGVREYWLVHPVDRIVTMYRLGEDGSFDRPVVVACTGSAGVEVLPGIEINWDRVFAGLPREV